MASESHGEGAGSEWRAAADWGDGNVFQPLFPFVDLGGDSPLSLAEAIKMGFTQKDGVCALDSDQYLLHEAYGVTAFGNLDQNLLIQEGSQLELMSRDEFLAVYFYTTEWKPRSRSLYIHLNRDLTDKERSLSSKWKHYLHYFFSALRKIASRPIFQDLYRGVSRNLLAANPKKYSVGSKFVEYATTSTTSKLDVISNFLGEKTCTIFTINGAFSARSIHAYSAISSEQEFIFPSASCFEVVSVMRRGGTQWVQLRQVPSLENKFFCLEPPSVGETEGKEKQKQSEHASEAKVIEHPSPSQLRTCLRGHSPVLNTDFVWGAFLW